MKKSKVVIPALGLIALSTAASITGTVAWFSANQSVSIKGMTVSTKVGDNLLVSGTNANAASYSTSLEQERTGVLEPVSSVDGVDFYYTATDNVQNGGDAIADEYVLYAESTSLANTNAGKTNYDAGFQTNYALEGDVSASNVYYGFIDYAFYVKAVNGGAADKYLILHDLNITYDGDIISEKAWRVAVFDEAASEYVAIDGDVAVGARKAMLTPSGAANFTTGQAVSSTSGTGSVAYTSAAWHLDTIEAGATEYNKITVRLWLEGEDNTCNNDTFASLTANWKLDVEVKLEDANTNAITNIRSVAAVATKTTTTGTVALHGDTASSYQWYLVTGNSAISGATAASYTNDGAARDVYCIVKTAAGRTYKSNVLSLDAGA